MAREGIEAPTRGFSGRRRLIRGELRRTVRRLPARAYGPLHGVLAPARTLQGYGVQVLLRYWAGREDAAADREPAGIVAPDGGPARNAARARLRRRSPSVPFRDLPRPGVRGTRPRRSSYRPTLRAAPPEPWTKDTLDQKSPNTLNGRRCPSLRITVALICLRRSSPAARGSHHRACCNARL
jgi:hypothetical protein